MELMIVVVLIGILTVMAIPTMAEARYNARTMDDATKIAELYREARTRAMGRGAAMLVTATSSSLAIAGGADLGTFMLYEAQISGTAAATSLLPLPGGSPVSSCGAPIANYWATATNVANSVTSLMDQVNLNQPMEQAAKIWTVINDGNASTQALASLCYTPLGKTYYQPATVTPTFTPGVNLLHGALQIAVQRSGVAAGTKTGITRTVIIPDSGSTRIISR